MHDELKRALDAHREWKDRLMSDIAAGATELEPRDICRDDRCEVGEWIHKKAGWMYRSNRHFSQVKEKHATFHREAGKVVALIKAGKLVEAQREIESGGYSRATRDLTGELSQWLRELFAEPKRRMHQL